MNTRDIYFQLPKTSIKGIPIFSPSGTPISFGFIEVGCRSVKKRGKVKSQTQLFLKYWGDNYRREAGFTPLVHRMIAYYDPSSNPRLINRKNRLDAVLFYSYISPQMLAAMDDEDKKEIYRVVHSKNKKRNMLEEILENNDADRLHKMIIDGKDQRTTHIRGKMAEILVQKDVSNNLPEGMNFFGNTNIFWKDLRYDNGTEVDCLLQSYGKYGYEQLIANIRNLDHVRVRDRWHPNQY